MTATLIPQFQLEPPHLPDLESTERMIRTSVSFDVRGRVAAVAGESIEIEGMTAPLGAICQLRSSDGVTARGRVIGFHGVRPVLAPLERLGALSSGDPVRLIDTTLRLRVGASLCGRVIDAFGHPLDGMPLPQNLVTVDADRDPPESLDRPPIDTPLETGVQAIDAMLTCGQGQRLGIFAGSGVGKSTLLGMLARGSEADRIVIGLVGERGREVKEFLTNCLGETGFARSVVVVATSDRPAAQRVCAAWTATAIAEAYRDEGHNVLLLLDSVTRFALAQRELGLAAGEPPTTRGYPPSVFNMLPRLVERSGRTSKGSITAFYTVLGRRRRQQRTGRRHATRTPRRTHHAQPSAGRGITLATHRCVAVPQPVAATTGLPGGQSSGDRCTPTPQRVSSTRRSDLDRSVSQRQ